VLEWRTFIRGKLGGALLGGRGIIHQGTQAGGDSVHLVEGGVEEGTDATHAVGARVGGVRSRGGTQPYHTHQNNVNKNRKDSDAYHHSNAESH
jgi:hypothetical protein